MVFQSLDESGFAVVQLKRAGVFYSVADLASW